MMSVWQPWTQPASDHAVWLSRSMGVAIAELMGRHAVRGAWLTTWCRESLATTVISSALGVGHDWSEIQWQHFASRHRKHTHAAKADGLAAWPDWRNDRHRNLQRRVDEPVEGVLFAVEHGFWHPEWPERPSGPDQASQVARRELQRAPRLAPLYGNRCVPTYPPEPGNPVFSCYQTDIICFTVNLLDWFDREFNPPVIGRAPVRPARETPYWSWFIHNGW